MKTIDKTNFFYCYDPECSNFLTSSGIRYILKARSVRDENLIFTMYFKDRAFYQALDEFKALKNKQ